MKKRIIFVSALTLSIVTVVAFDNGFRRIREFLRGFEEVPAVSTIARGDFKAKINRDETEIAYELSYADLEGGVTQAHIHLGQRHTNGGISVWLCSNLASPPTPAGTQPCPPPPATITGVITAADVTGPTAQGIEPGAFAELIRAIRADSTYVNVHSSKFPGGEIRSQIDNDDGDKHGGNKHDH